MNDATASGHGIFRAMLRLALPVLAEESLNLLVGYTDWFLAGHFLPGDEPKAAMGLMSYVIWILPNLFAVIGIGTLAVVARLIGAGQREEAAHVARQSLLAGGGAAVIGMVLAFALGGRFVWAMQLRGEAAQLATRYIYIVAPAIPLIMCEYVGTACLRGAGDTVTGLLARVVMNIVNVALSTSLITGLGLFASLGWDSLAIGAACGHATAGLIVLVRLTRGGGGLALFPAGTALRAGPGTEDRNTLAGQWSATEGVPFRVDWTTIRRVLRIGVPGGIDVWSVLLCHLIYVAIINSLGTLAQAAHGLGVQIEAMSYLPGSAFQVAAATIAGQSLGAADQRRAVRGVLLCVLSAAAIMTCAGLAMYCGGESIALFFTGQRSDTTILTGSLLQIVALSCPFLAVLMVLSGALRGSGDTAWPLAITFIGLVGIRIPGACLLAWEEIHLPLVDLAIPAFGLGVAGAWWAMITDVIVRSFLAAGRFVQGGWKRVSV